MLSSVTEQTELQRLEQGIRCVSTKATVVRIKGRVLDVQRVIEQFDDGSQVSIQNVSSRHRYIHLNTRLAAISFLIAGCLLSPVNCSVIAPRKTGKSTLI